MKYNANLPLKRHPFSGCGMKWKDEKDIAESRFPASNNFKVKNFHPPSSLLPAFSLFLQFRRKKNYGKARRCFQESDFSR